MLLILFPPPCIKSSRIKQKISNFIKQIVYEKLSCSISRIRKKMLEMKDKVSSRITVKDVGKGFGFRRPRISQIHPKSKINNNKTICPNLITIPHFK